MEEAQVKEYKTTLITLQVGSRGVPDFTVFETLARMPPKVFRKLLDSVSKQALVGSFSIWCSRNRLSKFGIIVYSSLHAIFLFVSLSCGSKRLFDGFCTSPRQKDLGIYSLLVVMCMHSMTMFKCC